MGVRITDKDKGYAAVRSRLASMGKYSAEVGLPGEVADQASADGRATLKDIGIWMEFGTSDGHVPARPWLRGWVDENQTQIQAKLAELLTQVAANEMTELDAINEFGKWCVEGIRDRIARFITPLNAEATLAGKDGITPLIDEQVFYSAITYKVLSGGF